MTLLTISLLPFIFICYFMIDRTQEAIANISEEVTDDVVEHVVHLYDENIKDQARALDMQLLAYKNQLLQLRTFTERMIEHPQAFAETVALIESEGGFIWEPTDDDRSNIGFSAISPFSNERMQLVAQTKWLEPAMKQVVDGYEAIVASYFITGDSSWRIYPPLDVEKEYDGQFLQAMIDLSKQPFYTAPPSNDPKMVGWTTPYIDTTHRNEMFSLVTAVNDKSGEQIGVLGFDIQTDEALKHLLTLEFKEASSFALLTDASFQPIAHHPLTIQPDRLTEQTLRQIVSTHEPWIERVDEYERVFLSAPIEQSGWHLIFSIRTDEIVQDIHQFTDRQLAHNEQVLIEQLLWISIATLLLVIVCAIAMWKSFTKPVHEIVEGMERMQDGTVTSIAPQQLEEFEDVRQAFHTMNRKMNDLLMNYRTLNADLEHKVDERTEQLEEMNRSLSVANEQLIRADEQRSKLLANLAHDLKTPITLTLGYMEAIEDGMISPDRYDTYFDRMRTHLQSMTKLMKNMAELNDIETSKQLFNFERFRADDLFHKLLTPFHDQANISITIDERLPMIQADPHYVQRLVYNLVDNALKYGTSDQFVRISVREQRDVVQLIVHNDGRPIDPEALPYVFDRFYRVDRSRNSEKKGNGLGLAIVKEIVEAHDASISVTSDERRGTTFTVCFPTIKKDE